MYAFGVYMYGTWHIDKTALSCGFSIAIGVQLFSSCQHKKKSIMEMRLGDYKYPTDYRAHKQWGHDTLWTILNVFHLAAWPLSFETGPWRLFGSERDSHWIHTDFLFHASVAYRTLCSVAYTRERSDSTQACVRWYNNDKCCVLLAPATLGGLWFPLWLYGFH